METSNIDYQIIMYLVLTTDTNEENITMEDLN